MIRRSLLALVCLTFCPPALAQDTEEYRIGPDDILQLQVWSRPDMNAQVQVDPSGQIQVPLLGKISVQDRTPSDVAQELTRRYGILDAAITEVLVSVVEYRSRAVTVVGEVHSPGRYTFRIIPNVWEVILQAGGPTSAADLAGVQIARKVREPGEAPAISVDLSRGVLATDPDSLPLLRPQDTIVVPSLVEEAASGGASFQVLGAVARPGVYRLTPDVSLVEALAMSGGPLTDADLRKVGLTRRSENGVASYLLDVEGHLYRAEPLADFTLREGDTVTVPAKGGKSITSVLSNVFGLASIVTAVSSLVLALN